MFLNKITILNYKNIAEAHLQLSPKINCLIGNNGEGKTNFLDALYFLSFCKSANNPIDSQLIRHSQDYFLLEAEYINSNDNTELVSCGLKRGVKKTLKRNKKAYKRLSEHIGLIPLIMISPNDISLIEGGSEERRRLMDVVISQYDNTYIDTLTRYNKALTQRNAMLKAEEEPDLTLMELMEQEMGRLGEAIYSKRKEFIEQLTPIFQHIYKEISASGERVAIEYKSHCQRGPLLDVISRDRAKDRIMGYSLHGIHRDDLNFMLDDFMMKREGSQGQNKTFVTALKLAQFDFCAISLTPAGAIASWKLHCCCWTTSSTNWMQIAWSKSYVLSRATTMGRYSLLTLTANIWTRFLRLALTTTNCFLLKTEKLE